MLSASCYFRGNYMTRVAASNLLTGLCAVPELIPDFWNVHEPIDIPGSTGFTVGEFARVTT
jgi:hypothetical protein